MGRGREKKKKWRGGAESRGGFTDLGAEAAVGGEGLLSWWDVRDPFGCCLWDGC
jgi:hypothetical protein